MDWNIKPSEIARWSNFRDRQRRWLSSLGIYDKPWLILGAAPSPTIPEGILSTHARVDINNAGLTAKSLGLGRADLTIRKKSKSWDEHPTLNTRGLLWYHTRPSWVLKINLMMMPQVQVDSVMKLTRSERDALVDIVAGEGVRGTGDIGKASNGIAAACYALFVGVPEIVLCGISLTKQGHSYTNLVKTRLQVEEDALVLSHLKTRPDVFTTEPDLAAEAGIKLWQAVG
ncbi:hypothetical protein ACSBOB_12555 [Mesorhizobium sp. ASY16-5R]|uniref:hypothetical protein n=1 Tax=Mesorhizobium sp. ASY16-5R TaxID=3445772 RepID=UPI003FA0F7C0